MGNVRRIDVIQVLMPLIAAGLRVRAPREVSKHNLPGELLPLKDASQGILEEETPRMSSGAVGAQAGALKASCLSF